MRTKYRFSHRGADGRYYWYSARPIDSRYEQISCPVVWFWKNPGEMFDTSLVNAPCNK